MTRKRRLIALGFATPLLAAMLVSGVFDRVDQDAADNGGDPLESAGQAAFRAVPEPEPLPPWTPDWPEDHAAHADAAAEAWSVTAHLRDADGARLGLQFNLSRLALSAGGVETEGNPWVLRAAYRARAGLLDGESGVGWLEENFSRGAGGAAGAGSENTAIHIDDMRFAREDHPQQEVFRASARIEGLLVELTLVPQREPVAFGVEGGGPVQGYSIGRLEVAGTLGEGAAARSVTGHAWLDHAWGNLPPPGGPLQRDRIVLHLDDGSDVSIVQTLRRDGRGTSTLEGLISLPGDEPRAVTFEGWRLTEETDRNWVLSGAETELRLAPVTEKGLAPGLLGGDVHLMVVDGLWLGQRVSGSGTLFQDIGGGV